MGTPDFVLACSHLVVPSWAFLHFLSSWISLWALWGKQIPKYPTSLLVMSQVPPTETLARHDPFHGTCMQEKWLVPPNPACILEIVTSHLLAVKALPQSSSEFSTSVAHSSQLNPFVHHLPLDPPPLHPFPAPLMLGILEAISSLEIIPILSGTAECLWLCSSCSLDALQLRP